MRKFTTKCHVEFSICKKNSIAGPGLLLTLCLPLLFLALTLDTFCLLICLPFPYTLSGAEMSPLPPNSATALRTQPASYAVFLLQVHVWTIL